MPRNSPQWQLQRSSTQVLMEFAKTDDNAPSGRRVFNLNKKDPDRRSLLKEIPWAVLFRVALFLDINTITMGLSLVASDMLRALDEREWTPAHFSKLRIFKFNSLAQNVVLSVTMGSLSAEDSLRAPMLMLENKKLLHYDLHLETQLSNKNEIMKAVSSLRAGLSNEQFNCYQLQNSRYAISTISITKCGSRIVLGTEQGDLEIFDHLGNRLNHFNWGDDAIVTTDIDLSGKILVVGSGNVRKETHNVRLINIASGKIFKQTYHIPILKIIYNHDVSLMGVQFERGRVHVYNVNTWAMVHSIECDFFTLAYPTLSFSPDGKWLVFADNTSLVIYNTETWEELQKVQHNKIRIVTTMSFSNDGTLLAIAYRSGFVVWNLREKQFEFHRGQQIKAIGFSADNKKIMTVSFDNDFKQIYKRGDVHNAGMLKIWDLETKQCETKEISRDRMISACSIAGDHILFGHTDGSLAHYRFSSLVKPIETVESEVVSSAPAAHC